MPLVVSRKENHPAVVSRVMSSRLGPCVPGSPVISVPVLVPGLDGDTRMVPLCLSRCPDADTAVVAVVVGAPARICCATGGVLEAA